jgi:hypothetical protein
MAKKRLDVVWEREVKKEDFNPSLKHYYRYLQDNGLRESTITSYVFRYVKLDRTPEKKMVTLRWLPLISYIRLRVPKASRSHAPPELR